MEYSLLDQGSMKRVAFYGNIKASSRTKFLELGERMPESEQKEWCLDVSDFEYIDSAGLGMLIELNETAQKHGISLSISGANELVMRMLKLTKLDVLFEIIE